MYKNVIAGAVGRILLTTDPMKILNDEKNMRIAEFGLESYGVVTNTPIMYLMHAMITLGLMGCAIVILIKLGKFSVDNTGKVRDELKTTILQKVMIVVLLGCGLSFFDFLRKIAVALVTAS